MTNTTSRLPHTLDKPRRLRYTCGADYKLRARTRVVALADEELDIRLYF
jgi:hypothetical protein